MTNLQNTTRIMEKATQIVREGGRKYGWSLSTTDWNFIDLTVEPHNPVLLFEVEGSKPDDWIFAVEPIKGMRYYFKNGDLFAATLGKAGTR